jgi:8-oxo-dGTP diphosphatase
MVVSGGRMPPRLFHVGIKGVIAVDGRVLLLQRADGDGALFWDLPGGRIEAGEQIEQALRRELREEVPSIARVEIGDLLHAAPVPAFAGSENGLLLLYYRVLAEVPRVVLSAEHGGYTWAGAEDLPALARRAGQVAILGGTLKAMDLALRRSASQGPHGSPSPG